MGLDHYQVRIWTGWHRHVTLAMLALAFRRIYQGHARRSHYQHRFATELCPVRTCHG